LAGSSKIGHRDAGHDEAAFEKMTAGQRICAIRMRVRMVALEVKAQILRPAGTFADAAGAWPASG
jgi:hypothetical protein